MATQRAIALVNAANPKKKLAAAKSMNLDFSKNLDKKRPKSGKKIRAKVCGPSPHLTRMVKRLGSKRPLKVSAPTSLKIMLISDGARLYIKAETMAPVLLLVI